MSNRSINAMNVFLETLRENGYSIASRYVDSHTHVNIICPNGHEYPVAPYNFKNGRRCPRCSGFNSIDRKHIFEDVIKSSGYHVIGEWKGTSKKILISCDLGHEYEVTPYHFIDGNRCPVCAGTCPKAAKSDFFDSLDSSGYKVLGEYINNSTKILVSCVHEHTYEVTPLHFKSGRRCPVCAGTCPKAARDKFMSIASNSGYKVVGEYKNTSTKIEMMCPKGTVYSTKPDNFTSGQRCPCCALYGFDISKPTSIYLVRYTANDGTRFVKFGVTNREVNVRISEQIRHTKTQYTILTEIRFPDGTIPRMIESELIDIRQDNPRFACKEEYLSNGHTETMGIEWESILLDKIHNCVDR